MDKKIIKAILSNEFWKGHQRMLVAHLFSDEIRELFEVIEQSHDRHGVDIPADALVALWKEKYPVATRAETSVIEAIVEEIKNEEELPPELTSEIIEGLWKRDIGKKIGQLGIAIAEGRDEAFDKLKQLIRDTDDGFMPDDFPDPVTDDINELIALTSNENRFSFNIRALRDKLYGIGPSDFMLAFARPETGKTGFVVSLSCGPGGFCEQGAKVLYLGNEEDVKRTKLRAIQAFTGMKRDEIMKNPKHAMETYGIISNRMIMQNVQGWDIHKVNAYIAKIQPDIVIIDQLDKINIDGNYEKSVDKLRELYTQTRMLAGINNVAIIGVSQASADAEGKTVLDPSMMENSKTGKYAEADVILGVGKYPDNADGTQDPIRFLTLGKNKITGWHGTLTCKIEPEVSRYVD